LKYFLHFFVHKVFSKSFFACKILLLQFFLRNSFPNFFLLIFSFKTFS
jgi:hypothetical protein